MLFKTLLLIFTSMYLFADIKESSVFVYNCSDDYSFVAKVQQETVWLFLPTKTVKAAQQISASGAKYTVDNIIYWRKGSEAALDEGKRKYRCENDAVAAAFERAKLNGVGFCAIGNEPGWILEITSDKEVSFLTNLGQERTDFEVTEKFSDYSSTEYEMRSENNILLVRIENRQCQDTMIDRTYESTVYINFDGVNMKGCGKALF